MTLYKGVTKFYVISSLCAISQMPQQHFPHKFHMTLHKTRMFFNIWVEFLQFIYFFSNLPENIRNGLGRDAPDTMQKRIARLDIQFYSRNTCSILAAVVLLF